MDVVVRKVFKHGKSLTFTLPRKWIVPEVLHVYSNGIYFVYSPIAGLETSYNVKRLGSVKRRIARVGASYRYFYYLLTLPKRLVEELGIKPGDYIIIVRRFDFGEPTYIGMTEEKPLIQLIDTLLKKTYSYDSFEEVE